MTKAIFAAAAFAAFAIAADPSGATLWRASELKGYEKSLAPKMNAGKVASTTLETYDRHLTMIAHREGPGESEIHEKMADFFIVQSGEATLVVGGKMRGSKSTGPGELRGPSIDGGTKHKLTTGDVVHIPANVPHQLLINDGKQFTYFVIKVESK